MHWPVATCQTRTVLSRDPDTICDASCENATKVTQSVWPSSVWMHWPVATCQTRTVLSLDPDMICDASCENATVVMPLRMALERLDALARGYLPDPRRVVPGSGHDMQCIVRKCHRGYPVRMALERLDALARGYLPDPHRVVVGSGHRMQCARAKMPPRLPPSNGPRASGCTHSTCDSTCGRTESHSESRPGMLPLLRFCPAQTLAPTSMPEAALR